MQESSSSNIPIEKLVGQCCLLSAASSFSLINVCSTCLNGSKILATHMALSNLGSYLQMYDDHVTAITSNMSNFYDQFFIA